MRELPDQGVPDSLTCRWCGRVKNRVASALLCTQCDSPDHTAATWLRES